MLEVVYEPGVLINYPKNVGHTNGTHSFEERVIYPLLLASRRQSPVPLAFLRSKNNISVIGLLQIVTNLVQSQVQFGGHDGDQALRIVAQLRLLCDLQKRFLPLPPDCWINQISI